MNAKKKESMNTPTTSESGTQDIQPEDNTEQDMLQRLTTDIDKVQPPYAISRDINGLNIERKKGGRIIILYHMFFSCTLRGNFLFPVGCEVRGEGGR